MDDTVFYPPRRRGLVFQITIAILLAVIAGFLYYRAALLPIGGTFMLTLTGALLLTLPIPFLLYGAYALHHSVYQVTRDRVTLQWGWWVEEIPMLAIKWAQTQEGLPTPLPLPFPRWPGMIVGVRTLPSEKITFMAADKHHGIIIGTDYGLYFISPSSPEDFLRAFRRAAEEGVLETITPHLQRPAHWLRAIWQDRWARATLLTAWMATLLAFIWSNLAASGITWPLTTPATSINTIKAVFLAITAWLFQGINLGLGLFAYQSPQGKATAYLIWLVGAIAALGFLASVAIVLAGGKA